jgi:hypothetical protein
VLRSPARRPQMAWTTTSRSSGCAAPVRGNRQRIRRHNRAAWSSRRRPDRPWEARCGTSRRCSGFSHLNGRRPGSRQADRMADRSSWCCAACGSEGGTARAPSYVDFSTDNLQVKATKRFSFGWSNWRRVSGSTPCVRFSRADKQSATASTSTRLSERPLHEQPPMAWRKPHPARGSAGVEQGVDVVGAEEHGATYAHGMQVPGPDPVADRPLRTAEDPRNLRGRQQFGKWPSRSDGGRSPGGFL